uniref:Uncharacterized protein n=1 Tax=Anopheles culicifacies TaxID=139723 RepID=A0A182M360_9DIPT
MMDRIPGFVALFLLLVLGVDSQMVCYLCNNCESNGLGAVVCGHPSSGGGSGVGPTLPTSPRPTSATTTTASPQVTWYPPLSSTVTPWGRSTGYVCYRIQRYVPSTQNHHHQSSMVGVTISEGLSEQSPDDVFSFTP